MYRDATSRLGRSTLRYGSVLAPIPDIVHIVHNAASSGTELYCSFIEEKPDVGASDSSGLVVEVPVGVGLLIVDLECLEDTIDAVLTGASHPHTVQNANTAYTLMLSGAMM